MITEIPSGQLCQAFDPIMIFPEKTKYIIDDHMKANTSCVAPAYIYVEGSRGKRFLCDYHYFFEKDTVRWRTPEQWPLIEGYVVDNIESIKNTFAELLTNRVVDGILCWCNKQSYVLCIHKKSKHEMFFCNFHYRKAYYRHLSNKVDFLSLFDVIDERKKIKISLHQEANDLKYI